MLCYVVEHSPNSAVRVAVADSVPGSLGDYARAWPAGDAAATIEAARGAMYWLDSNGAGAAVIVEVVDCLLQPISGARGLLGVFACAGDEFDYPNG